MCRKLFAAWMVLALLGGMFVTRTPVSAMPQLLPAAPSSWCVAGDFNSWNNASTPLYDDGTHGDVIPEDNIFSLDYTVAAAGNYGWKIVKCGDWETAYPAQNAWLNTAAANQVVKITFDANNHANDAGWDLLPAQNIVNAVDTLPASFTAVGSFQGWVNNDPNTLMAHVGSGISMSLS